MRPHAAGDGATRDEAIENVKGAIQVYIEALEQDGLPVPGENRRIIRDAGLTVDEFNALVKE